MSFTNDQWLPSLEELDVTEINMTSPPLRAGAHHFGKYCDNQSKEFMLCSKEEKDPRKCLNEGKEVTRCALRFFQGVKKNCAEEFTQYWQCLDHGGWDMNYRWCKKQQGVFDKCMLEKMNIERPPLGYFAKVRVHNTTRQKPKHPLPIPEPTPDPPNWKEEPVPESAKHGTRYHFFG